MSTNIIRQSFGVTDPANPTASLNGFMDYNDAASVATPITVVADQWITLTNDGAGAFSNFAFKPFNVTNLIDVSTGYIDPTELNLGTSILIRNDYSVTPNTNNALLEFRYSLGTGFGEYTLEKTVGRLDNGSGKPYRQSLVTDMIYMGDTNTRDNPIKIQIKLSTGGTVVNAGTVIQVLSR